MVDLNKLIIDKISDVRMFDKTTGELFFYMDEIKGGSLENGEEKAYVTGSAGVRLAALNRNQSTRFTCQNGYLALNTLATQFGTEKVMGTASAKVQLPCMELLTTTNGTSITLTNTPVAVITGKPVPFIYAKNADGSPGQKYAAGSSASATEFAISDKAITLPTSVFSANDQVYVFYDYETEDAIKISRTNTNFAKNGRVVIGILAKDPCDNGKTYYTCMVIDSASADANVTTNLMGDDFVHDFACDALPNMCSATKEFFNWVIPEPPAA
jgi:hypothetical protein